MIKKFLLCTSLLIPLTSLATDFDDITSISSKWKLCELIGSKDIEPSQILLTINQFPKLEEIKLTYLQIEDPIPDLLGDLTHLQIVDLSCNRLTGSIPSSLDNLINLKLLSLVSVCQWYLKFPPLWY